jgi:hypothetical protein
MAATTCEMRQRAHSGSILKRMWLVIGLFPLVLPIQACELIQQLQNKTKDQNNQSDSVNIERNDLELSPRAVLGMKSDEFKGVFALITDLEPAEIQQKLDEAQTSCESSDEKLNGVMILFNGDAVDEQNNIIAGKYSYKRPEPQKKFEYYEDSVPKKPKKKSKKRQTNPEDEDPETEEMDETPESSDAAAAASPSPAPSPTATPQALGLMLTAQGKKSKSSTEKFEIKLPDFVAVSMSEDGEMEAMYGTVTVKSIDDETYMIEFNLKGENSDGKFVGSAQFKLLESPESDVDECKIEDDEFEEDHVKESDADQEGFDSKPSSKKKTKKKSPQYGSAEFEIKGLPTESNSKFDYLKFSFEPVGESGKPFVAETDLLETVNLPSIVAGKYTVKIEPMKDGPEQTIVKSSTVDLEIKANETVKVSIDLSSGP